MATTKAELMRQALTMEIRRRTNDDLEAAVRLAELVHELDGYPRYLPGDLGSFVAANGSLGSWVAIQGYQLVGHVALHQRTSPQVMALASQVTGLPADRLAVIARLMVAPAVRRAGIGRALLQQAADQAVALGTTPILDVVTVHLAAIELYERCGWSRAGKVVARFEDGHSLDEFVYVYPGADPSAER